MNEDTQLTLSNSTETQQELVRVVNQVNLAFRQFVQQKLKEHKIDLTFEMLQVLGQLWEKDGVNQQELANAVLKDKASLVYLLDNLTRRELVTRQEDAADRRNKLVFLTIQGRQLRNLISPMLEEMYRLSDAAITEQQVLTTIKILRQVIANLK